MTEDIVGKPRIKWADESARKVDEVIKPTDKLVVDPNLFKGQFQTDADLCVYMVLAAQLHLVKEKESSIPWVNRKATIEGFGFKRIAETLRNEVKTTRLSNWQLREILNGRQLGSKKIFRLSDYMSEGESV